MIKIDVKKIDSAKREINIEVTGDRVKNKFEDAFKKISLSAKVPGFRVGHVPRDILEKNFSSHAQESVLKELIPEVYEEAIKNEGLDVIDSPEISEVKLERSRLCFKATVEVSPLIELKNYKKIKVEYKKIEVTPDEIKRSLETLKESRKINNLDDNFAKGIGYPNLAELEKAIERQIFIQKENQQKQKIENEIIENIMKDLDFKVSQTLVNRQLQDLVSQAKVNLALKGVPREKIDERQKELSKELEPQARRQVKIYLVLAEIAKKENIPNDEHLPQRVMEFLLKEADWREA
jgi:FKBP-type peptidyl-prolyl cis-trans isomerase (trigger factor)